MNTTSWHSNFINVLRNVIFDDTILKEMMLIPNEDKQNIVLFRDKYFINEVISDTLLDDVPVRVVYHEDESIETNSMNVVKARIYFDIYVSRKHAYDYGRDRMLHRGTLIAERLNKLLTGKTYNNITFRGRGIYDTTSKREGYDRKTVVFLYKRIFN